MNPQPKKEHFSSLTLTIKFDLVKVKVHPNHLGQRWFCSKVNFCRERHTREPSFLPGGRKEMKGAPARPRRSSILYSSQTPTAEHSDWTPVTSPSSRDPSASELAPPRLTPSHPLPMTANTAKHSLIIILSMALATGFGFCLTSVLSRSHHTMGWLPKTKTMGKQLEQMPLELLTQRCQITEGN